MAKFAYLESVEFFKTKVDSAVQNIDEVQSDVASQVHGQVVIKLVVQPQRELLLLLNVADRKLQTSLLAFMVQGEKVGVTQNRTVIKRDKFS